MDALSELLKVVKLSGAMFFNAECAAPWRVRSATMESFRRHIAFPCSHVIEFHLITEGRAYIVVGTESTALTAGDVVMLPHGDVHYMGNGSDTDTIDGEKALAALLRAPICLSKLGSGDGEKTRMICGYLACEAALIRPAIAGLPRVVRVPIRADAAGEWLENSIRHVVKQATAAAPGSDIILARLAEVLFTETLRRYLLQLPAGRTGWLAGARDAAVGRALAALHRDPSHNWTLDELAQTAGVSRSALTERFARYLSQGPMAYLADWRLELAADALRTSTQSILNVAAEVGYDSEAAFNRAFKRRFGKPPAQYRKLNALTPPALETKALRVMQR